MSTVIGLRECFNSKAEAFFAVGIQVSIPTKKMRTNKASVHFRNSMVRKGGLECLAPPNPKSGLFCPSLIKPKNIYVFFTVLSLAGFESPFILYNTRFYNILVGK